MSKTQIAKIVILVAMIAVMALLIHRWQAEFGNTPAQATTSSQTQSQVPSLPSESSQPTQSTTPVLSGNDRPAKHALQATGQIISVKTDVLDAQINLNGGNLVNVKLPKYPQTLKDKTPVQLFDNQSQDFYIAQSGLIGQGLGNQPVAFTSASTSYNLGDQQSINVDLKGKTATGVDLIKRYTFSKDSYQVKVTYLIQNHTGKDFTGRFYGQLLRTPPAKRSASLLMHYATFTGAAYSTTDEHYEKLKFSNMAENNLNTKTKAGWVSMIQHYFISAWVPNQQANNTLYTRKLENNVYSIGVASPSITVKNGASGTTDATLYVGPAIPKRLNATAPYLNLTIDYGFLAIISVFLFWVMSHIFSVVGNWGVSIILVTICIKIVFYPLSAKSFRSMAKMRMLQPKMKALKEKLGDDRQALGKATMELYRKEKVNPLSGCLPIIIQIPVFLALYWMLMASVELRQAPFMLWIQDLSTHDPYFVLPILMGLSMFLQQRLNPPPPDPTQAKIMMALPVIFTVLFLGFPAGLVLYWLVNNCVGILQQWYVLRKVTNEGNARKA